MSRILPLGPLLLVSAWLFASVAVAAPPAKSSAAVGPQITTFPAVDTSRLDPAQMAFFTKVANEEVCPCDCPKSFGQCLQEGTKCKPAVLLAEWMVAQLEDGSTPDMLQDALTRELTGGFASAPRTIDIKGYGTKGAATPRFTVVEYADFECQHCKATSPHVDDLVKRHPEVKVVYKHYPLSFHPMARKAAIAAEAAGRQNKFWPMHDAIFATQDLLSDELLLGHAKALGLDMAKFQKDIADPELHKRVDASRAEADAFGVAATPAFFINGRAYFLSRNVDGFELRFKMEEARAGSSCQ